MTSPKASRIEVRAEAELIDLIQRAAKAVHEPTSEFIRKAARSRADIVLHEELITVMPAEQFDELFHSLDFRADTSRLAEEAAKPRIFEQK